MRVWLARFSLALAVLLPAAAWAQDRPLTQPTRDVDVVYLVAGPSTPLSQRMRWGITAGKLRVDPPSAGMYVIIDTATHSMEAVREGDRSVLTLGAGSGAVPGVTPGGSFVRRGDASVAGLSCTQWETRDTAGRNVLACLTADGVLLRVEADNLVLLEALTVNFAPLPDAVFRIPPDYRKITPPPLSQKPR
jgi:hypothetical protein